MEASMTRANVVIDGNEAAFYAAAEEFLARHLGSRYEDSVL